MEQFPISDKMSVGMADTKKCQPVGCQSAIRLAKIFEILDFTRTFYGYLHINNCEIFGFFTNIDFGTLFADMSVWTTSIPLLLGRPNGKAGLY